MDDNVAVHGLSLSRREFRNREAVQFFQVLGSGVSTAVAANSGIVRRVITTLALSRRVYRSHRDFRNREAGGYDPAYSRDGATAVTATSGIVRRTANHINLMLQFLTAVTATSGIVRRCAFVLPRAGGVQAAVAANSGIVRRSGVYGRWLDELSSRSRRDFRNREAALSRVQPLSFG